MLKVLIAVDGSDHARRAMHAVAALVKSGCLLQATLINVRDLPLLISGELPAADWEKLEQTLLARQQALLQAEEAHGQTLGLDLQPSCHAQGLAADEILRAARELAVDQVAMGRRGMGAIRSLLIGSVAQRVLQSAAAPVLLVH